MIFLKLVEIFTVALAGLFIVTQILLPLVRNQQTFPLFRKRGKLEKEISSYNQALEDRELEERAAKLKAKLERDQSTEEKK